MHGFAANSPDVAYDSELQQGHDLHKRRGKRRRRLKRGRLILLVVASVLLALDLVLLLIAAFKQGPERETVLHIATVYTLTAAACLILHVVVTRILYGAPPKPYRVAKRRKGAVLILVLVITAVIAALVLQVQFQARSALARAAAQARHTRLELSATDAVRSALMRLADDRDLAVDHLDEPWAAIRDYRDPAGVRCTVQVRDEQGFFNLNNLGTRAAEGQRLPEAVLLDILAACGVGRPVERVLALKDWIDEDQLGDAERSAYPELARGRMPPNRPLAAWSELLMVNGLERNLFERRPRGPLEDPLRGDLVDAVTVLPAMAARMTSVNVNTAGRDALRGVLGLEYSGLVERVLRERASRPLRDLDALGLQPDVLAAAGPYLGVRSAYFSVTATAEEDHDAAEVRALAVRDDQGAVRLVHWVIR